MKVAAQRKWAWPQVQLLKSLILVLMCNLLSLQGTLGKPAVHSGTSACFGHNRHSVQYLGYKVRQVHTQDTIHIYKEQPILKFQAIGSNWVFCIYGMETSRFKMGKFQWTFSDGEFSWTLFVHENTVQYQVRGCGGEAPARVSKHCSVSRLGQVCVRLGLNLGQVWVIA